MEGVRNSAPPVLASLFSLRSKPCPLGCVRPHKTQAERYYDNSGFMGRIKDLFYLVGAAALMIAGYEYSALWPLAILGIAIFLWRILNVASGHESFFIGWILGAIFWGGIFRWIFAVWPAEWAGLEKEAIVLPLVFAIWIFLSFVMGGAAGFSAFAVHKFKQFGLWRSGLLVFIPSVWALAEYVRAWIFSVVSWGEGALLGPHWTFGHIGYIFADTPMLKLLPSIGLYGFSWLAVFMAAFFVLFMQSLREHDKSSAARLAAIFVAVAAGIVFVFLLPADYSDAKPLNAVVFQSDTRVGPTLYRESVFGAIDEFLKKYPDFVPDVVVLPEDAQLFVISEEKEKELLNKFFREPAKAGLVVTSATVKEGKERVKYVYFIDKTGNVIGRQPKTFLIPGGEFMPKLLGLIFRSVGRKGLERTFIERRAISPRALEPPFVVSGGIKFASGVCSGVLTPHIYRYFAKSGAEVLLNPTSFSVFHGSPLLLKETARMARFQAASNSRPLLQSANIGYSMIIDGRGNITARAESLGAYIVAGSFVSNSRVTPTQKFGDWPVGVSTFIFAIYFLARFLCLRCLKNSI